MKYTGFFKTLLLSLVTVTMLVGCSNEPKYISVSFSALNVSCLEDAGKASVSLKLTGTPNVSPVIVDVEFEPATTGSSLNQIEFEKTTGFEVRPDSVTKVYFTVKDNDVLNDSQFKFKVRIVAASDAAIGSINTCNVTIVDDEKAERLNTGSYKMTYSTTGFTPLREGAGGFNLKLAKTGKYEYVAYNWFNMMRPRLVGVFDPVAKTLTFDGKDYDGPVFSSDDDDDDAFNAFGSAYYFYNIEMTQAMVFMGSGTDGKSPIVFSTDELQIDETGNIIGFAAGVSCSYKIFNYDTSLGADGEIVGEAVGIYDMITNPTITFNDTTRSYMIDEDGLDALNGVYYTPSYPIVEMPRAVKVF